MFTHLQIYDSRERRLVGCADALIGGVAAVSRLLPHRRPSGPPGRVLILRLERIGDLLMTLGAMEAIRARAPDAKIHLVVGSWNESLAALLPWIDSRETLDVPWLARHTPAASARMLVRRAWKWRAERFDLAVNCEPDIRSNLLLGLSGATRRVGFSSGGGAAFLTDALAYDSGVHTAANLRRLVDVALPAAPDASAAARFGRLQVPESARRQARRLLQDAHAGQTMVGLHASGGREIKQWHIERFAQVATRLAHDLTSTIVLTGTSEDRALVDSLRANVPSAVKVIDVVGAMELPVFAAVLEQLSLFLTCDTGPMHLAAAVGTPVVALFGPSDPRRYGPLTDRARVVTADLWCRPCNRVRRPPARCLDRVPDCLNAIDVDTVCRAALDLLNERNL